MFNLDLSSGRIREARQVESPNCDDRPVECCPELIVIHNISLPPGEFGGPWIDELFTNQLRPEGHTYFAEIHELQVSAHFLIRRDGELVQYVPVNRRAWHAGQSCFDGRERCNDFSIGIEMEGDDETPYEEIQYAALVGLLQELRGSIDSLAQADIVGHRDIAPGRKTDPGDAFDWQRLFSGLRQTENS